MGSKFLTVLNLSDGERLTPPAGLEKLLTVEEWTYKVFEVVKDVELPESFGKWLDLVFPWLGVAGKALPPVNAVFEGLRLLTKEQEPRALLYLACTVAYQTAAAKALKELGAVPERSVKQRLGDSTGTDVKTFGYFTVQSLMTSQFKRDADRDFSYYANQVYSQGVVDRSQRLIDQKFPDEFRLTLTHGKTLEKFEPARAYLEMDAEGAAARAALWRHADYCKWLYEGAAVLGEPYALKDIHVDTGCGVLTRKQLLERDPKDGRRKREPFRREDEHGGCKGVLDTVLGLIKERTFKHAIVIQGIAGSGKSTFAKQLAATLVDEGLQPILIRLRDVSNWGAGVFEILNSGIRLEDEEYLSSGNEEWPNVGTPISGAMFRVKGEFWNIRLCPYVLILDGWDEISVGATENFRSLLKDFLQVVRSELLGRSVKVGVVLTGRPSDVVDSAMDYFKDGTAFLTLRQLTPEQLEEYAEKLRAALSRKPFGRTPAQWAIPEQQILRPLFAAHRDEYERLQKAEEGHRDGAVLGVPFLAQLAFRLAAEPEANVAQLAGDKTILLRRVTDLVVEYADRSADEFGTEGLTGQEEKERVVVRIQGPTLRVLLQKLATTMTHSGREMVWGSSLQQVFRDVNIRGMEDADLGSKLTALMMSFYLKGGEGTGGCEFTHKSLREYLFAEAVVETLKSFTVKSSWKAVMFDLRWLSCCPRRQ